MSKTLTSDQVQNYHRDGLLFPLSALTPEEVNYFRAMHDELAHCLSDKPLRLQKARWHLFYKWACDLATHTHILDTVEDIIGSNILVHSSTVFSKYPGDNKFVSWHQDIYNLGLSEPRLVSAWVALTDSTPANGCLRLLPGTHLRDYEHLQRPHQDNLLGLGLNALGEFDMGTAVDVELQAGEMSFHHANIVHGSNPNTTSTPRIGFAIRYVATSVKQATKHYPVILARGEDHYHHYTIQDKPMTGVAQGLLAHESFSMPHDVFAGYQLKMGNRGATRPDFP